MKAQAARGAALAVAIAKHAGFDARLFHDRLEATAQAETSARAFAGQFREDGSLGNAARMRPQPFRKVVVQREGERRAGFSRLAAKQARLEIDRLPSHLRHVAEPQTGEVAAEDRALRGARAARREAETRGRRVAEIVLLFAAEGDVLSIYVFYAERRPGRGELFSEDLDQILGLLREFPHLGPVFAGPFHRRKPSHHSYAVFYEVAGSRVIVQGILSYRESDHFIRRHLGL